MSLIPKGLKAHLPGCSWSLLLLPLILCPVSFGVAIFVNGVDCPVPVLTPWSAIGGCGAGGSGGGAGDGIKWVGQGVSGGLLDVEVLPKLSVGQNFKNSTIAPRLSYKLNSATTVGLSFPFTSKTAEVQHQSHLPAETRITGGMGDLSWDISRTFGQSGEFSLNYSMSMPTAQYDIVRGSDRDATFLPSNLQKGSGLFNSTIGIGYTKDVEDGLWLFDLSYSHSWIVRMSGKNEMLGKYFTTINDKKNRRFYYRSKLYGENDLGDYTPPSVTTGIYYGYRGTPGMVYSFGMNFSAPLGVAWIRNPSPDVYNPRPDPDHKAWSASLIYGIEFSRKNYPVFIAFALPVHDKAAGAQTDEWDETPMSKWNAPDWEDVLQQWVVACGFKTTFF